MFPKQIPSLDEIWAELPSNEERKTKPRPLVRKRILIVSLCVSIVLLIASGSTFAVLYTRTNDAINPLFFAGPNKVHISEEFDGWNAKEVSLTVPDEPGAMPGVSRVMFVPYILDENGVNNISCDLAELSEPGSDGKMVLGDVVLEFNPTWASDWFFQDGFFYYRQVLHPGETTPVLLQRVSIVPGKEDKYSGDRARVNVEVLANILQSEGSASEAGKVLDTEWGVTVNGTTVSPKS